MRSLRTRTHMRARAVTQRRTRTSDTCQHANAHAKHAPTAPSSHTLAHRFTHKDRHITHTCEPMHDHTPNKDKHANIPLLCSAGGFLTGF